MNGDTPLPLHPELSFSQVLWINIRRDVRAVHSNEGVVVQGNGTHHFGLLPLVLFIQTGEECQMQEYTTWIVRYKYYLVFQTFHFCSKVSGSLQFDILLPVEA